MANLVREVRVSEEWLVEKGIGGVVFIFSKKLQLALSFPCLLHR
jgi:hypothetical protein